MKAILCRWLPCTNTKPARITATANGGNRIVIAADGTIDQAYAAAAVALCQKLGWKGPLLHGGLPDGSECFVFADSDKVEVP